MKTNNDMSGSRNKLQWEALERSVYEIGADFGGSAREKH